MGHTHFSTLPRSKGWQSVIQQISSGAGVAEIAALSIDATGKALGRAGDNPVYRAAVELLVQIPLAAREDVLSAGLGAIGLEVGPEPELADLVFAAGDLLDRAETAHDRHRDFADLSRRALLGALTATIEPDLPGLLEATSADLHVALRRLSQPGEFSRLARAFYSRLLSETLSYFLDRSLSRHVGHGQRFQGLGDRSRFAGDLDVYCREATRIIQEFSIGWYGKHAYRDADLSGQIIAGFGGFALRKITEELRRREGVG